MSEIKWDTMITAEQLEADRREKLADDIRTHRGMLLSETDFYMLQDAPPAPTGMAEYRQALRDITDQPGFPETVEWPKLPDGINA